MSVLRGEPPISNFHFLPQADKEFVWSLWKRLQVANPDISQAISLVVQR